VDTVSIPRPSSSADRIGFLGVFDSPAIESAFRKRHFRDDIWLCCFLVVAAMLRVSVLLVADYDLFGLSSAFWPLLAGRLVFLLVSASVLFALRRATSPEVASRLFFAWCALLGIMTVAAISARPPSHTGLLLMSFGVILVAYCVTPLPLSRQAILALSYSAAVLFVSRKVDSSTLSVVSAVYVMSNLFGAVTSWRINHRRREAFLGILREAELRANLEEAMAEIRTLRGLHCICAWCKRIRDEEEDWQSVERYVESRTHASFTHGICPECLQSQVGEIAQFCR
jgi:hypothetical protein